MTEPLTEQEEKLAEKNTWLHGRVADLEREVREERILSAKLVRKLHENAKPEPASAQKLREALAVMTTERDSLAAIVAKLETNAQQASGEAYEKLVEVRKHLGVVVGERDAALERVAELEAAAKAHEPHPVVRDRLAAITAQRDQLLARVAELEAAQEKLAKERSDLATHVLKRSEKR